VTAGRCCPEGFGAADFVWAASGRRLEVERDVYAKQGHAIEQLLAVSLAGRRKVLYHAPHHGISPLVPAGFSPDGRWASFGRIEAIPPRSPPTGCRCVSYRPAVARPVPSFRGCC
jgi:hypothetical protein